MTDTSLRYMEMLRLLPAYPRKITAADMHRQLESAGFSTDLRSVQRDLNKLSQRYHIVSDEARPAGWSWRKESGFSAPGMSLMEAMELDLTALHLSHLLPATVWNTLASRLTEAREKLKELSNTPLARWRSRVTALDDGQPLHAPQIAPGVLDAVHECLLQNLALSVEYRALDSEEPHRYEINPVALVYKGQIGYLVATFKNYEDPRHLALHRMSKPQVLKTRAKQPEGFDLQHYLREDAAFDLPGERELHLKLRVSDWLARHLEERRLSADQRIEKDKGADGRWLVHASVGESERLYWWLCSLGSSLEVIQPVALRRRLAAEFDVLARRYARTE